MWVWLLLDNMYIVYILKLENDKFYVSSTTETNFKDLLLRNFNGRSGALWTRLHKPIAVLELIRTNSLQLEKEKTLEYMRRYGWRNVRGYAWSARNLINPPKEL